MKLVFKLIDRPGAVRSLISDGLVGLSSILLLLTSVSVLQAAEDVIPHGEVAEAEGKGVVAAWYGCATGRYRHGVLGDAIEGACLKAHDHQGQVLNLELSASYVFEDVTPRLADMNGDGLNDIVTVRSDVDAGAALVIYGLVDGELAVIAETPPIGTANRWLAPAGIADFNNDGRNDVAYVQTPHIGGILRYWTMLDEGFTEIARMNGFSNHSIGATRVSISRVLDENKDEVPDLALPDRSGSETIIITLHPEPAVLGRSPFKLEFYD